MHTLLALLACTSSTTPPDVEVHPDPEPEDTVPAEPVALPPPIVINEVLASNATITWEGGTPDLVELFNPTDADVPLDGWTLSHDADERDGAALDGLVVPAGGFLVLVADEPDAPTAGHLGFTLDADGDQLSLWKGDAAVDRLVIPAVVADISLTRTPDGASRWAHTRTPTPGAPGEVTPADTDAPQVTAPPLGGLARPSLDCRPQVDGPVHAWEGRRVTLAPTCATGAPLQELRWFAPFAWDAGEEGRWTPALDEAGTWMVLVEVRPDGAAVPDTVVVEIQVADAWDAPGNVPVDPATYTEEWGVPVLHLRPLGDITDAYVPMQAAWRGERYEGQMKARGAASLGYPKQSYTLEFDPVSLPVPGGPAKDHLVLISDFDDNSHTRQRMVFEAWEAMERFEGAPRLSPHPWSVVVYLRGAYFGLYTAVDHVDDELIAERGFDDSGNLYKSVSHDANFYVKPWLAAGWEKKEGLPEDDYGDLEALTQWSGTVSDDTFARDAAGEIDVHDFMDWFLLVHHFAAGDSGGKNAYLYHDPTTSLWRYAPWDFNHALGQDWQTFRVGWDDNEDFVWTNGIFGHIQHHRALAAEQADRYAAMRAPGGPLALDTLLAGFDAIVAETGDAAVRDWQFWEADYRGYWGFRSDIQTCVGERALVRDWIVARDAFISRIHGPPAP